MQWINEPKDVNVVQPQDQCAIHLCFTRDDPPGPGACIVRFCLTRWCFIDDGTPSS